MFSCCCHFRVQVDTQPRSSVNQSVLIRNWVVLANCNQTALGFQQQQQQHTLHCERQNYFISSSMPSTVAYLLSLNFSKVLYVIEIKIGTSVSNSRLFSTITCLSAISIQQKPYHHPQSALFTLHLLSNGANKIRQKRSVFGLLFSNGICDSK